MSARRPTIVGVVVLFFFFLPYPVFSAASFIPQGIDTVNPVIGDSFIVQASATGASPSATYYLKCRIGPVSTSLTEGQTVNTQTNKWLDDTSAWVDMPQITVGGDGSWQGSLTCRIKNSAVDEAKMLFLRACLNANESCGTSFQSGSSLTLSPRAPTPTNTPVPTATHTPTPIPTNTSTPTTTPTHTSTPTKTPTPTCTMTPILFPTDNPSFFSGEKADEASTIGGVLGEITDTDIGSETSPDALSQKRPYILSLLFVSVGLAMLGAVYVIKIRYTRKQ